MLPYSDDNPNHLSNEFVVRDPERLSNMMQSPYICLYISIVDGIISDLNAYSLNFILFFKMGDFESNKSLTCILPVLCMWPWFLKPPFVPLFVCVILFSRLVSMTKLLGDNVPT